MRSTHILLLAACTWCCGGISSATAQVSAPNTAWTEEKNALLSTLQSMTHGAYSEAEWQAIYDDIHGLRKQAEAAGNDAGIIDLSLLLARVQSDMRKRHTDALYTLSNLKKAYETRTDVPVHRIYMGLAEVHGRLGDAAAIERLVEEFSNSVHYDPNDYAVTGGDTPSTPVAVVRPHAGGDPSITVSTMKRFAREAAFSAGKPFPEFQVDLRDGGATSLGAYRGKVLLVDCWVENWPNWKNNLPYVVSAYEKYHDAGFEILGVYLGRDAEVAGMVAAANGMVWPQVAEPRALARLLGVAGEPTGFLVDQNGQILGRNLSTPELVEKLRAALGITE